MPAEFKTVTWDEAAAQAARRLIRMALDEDLAGGRDLTSQSVASPRAQGAAAFVARTAGVVAGLRLLPLVAEEAGEAIEVEALKLDGDSVGPGQAVARMRGDAIALLTCERTMLNFLCRLSGVASLTRRFVEQTRGTRATIFDTRKTTPGWRLLEKYAVHCGGGHNHRLGLHDAVLIKDNHLAHAQRAGMSPAEAVRQARHSVGPGVVVEVEVDTLAQLEQVLAVESDIVLLDNMTSEQLARAVALRDAAAPGVVLEASGGVSLGTVAEIAKSGVDRISVGALTHSAVAMDFGLDWLDA